MRIDEMYEINCKMKTDINEHLPTLKRLASRCLYVTEFGVRSGRSTIALIAGRPKKLVSYDVDSKAFADHDDVCAAAKEAGVDFTFVKANDLEVDIGITEMLFIDTEHTYGQLAAELKKHAGHVTQYIVLHDTHMTSWGATGDSPQMWRAIAELILSDDDWCVLRSYFNNNGLTILSRYRHYDRDCRAEWDFEKDAPI